MPRDSFDVYYHQNGRWSVHASFESDQRELAIEEAKGVEAKLGYPARVVRETFFEDTNTSDAIVTWQGPKSRKLSDSDSMFGPGAGAKPAAKASGSPRRSAPAGAVSRPLNAGAAGKSATPKTKSKKKGSNVFVDLAIAIIISTVIAVVSAAGIALLTLQLQKTKTIAMFDSTPLIFGAFILAVC